MREDGVKTMSEHGERVFCSCLELTSLIAPFLWFGIMLAAFTGRIPSGASDSLVAGVLLLLIPASFLTGLGWLLLGHTILGSVLFVARLVTLVGALWLITLSASLSCEGRSCFGWAPVSSYLGTILALALVPSFSTFLLYKTGRGRLAPEA